MRKIAFWLSLILIFMIPWENSVIIAGVGRISRVFGLFVAAFWLATVIATGKFRKPTPFHALVFLYFFWSGISLIWSVNVSGTFNRIDTYVQLVGFIWLVWDLYTTPEAVRAGLQVYVLGGYVSAIDTISNYLSGVSRGSTPRYAASGFNANGLSLTLVLGLPLAWYLAISLAANDSARDKIFRVVNYAYIPLAVFAILLTASRTALFGMVPIFWFMLATYNRLRISERLLLSFFLVGTLYFLQPLVPQTSLDRLSTTQTELTEGDLNGRRIIWAEAMEVFQERPLLGYGGGTFKLSVGYKDKSAHNTYLGILVETGLVGFTLFALSVFASILHTRHLPKWDTIMWLTLIFVWAIGITTMSWELKKMTWLLLSMTVVHAAVYREQQSARQPVPILEQQSGDGRLIGQLP